MERRWNSANILTLCNFMVIICVLYRLLTFQVALISGKRLPFSFQFEHMYAEVSPRAVATNVYWKNELAIPYFWSGSKGVMSLGRTLRILPKLGRNYARVSGVLAHQQRNYADMAFTFASPVNVRTISFYKFCALLSPILTRFTPRTATGRSPFYCDHLSFLKYNVNARAPRDIVT